MTYYTKYVSLYDVEFMCNKTFIGTDLEILGLLAGEREYGQYKMPGRLKKSYRTVMRRLTKLENRGLVKVARRERSRKMGKKRKIYRLTFKGVVRYLSSISLKPLSLGVLAGETREDAVRRLTKDRARYLKEAESLKVFLEFYGRKLNYVVFKEIRWLVPIFPMKLEMSILSYVLEVADFMESYFTLSTPSVEGLRTEKSRLKKQKRQLGRKGAVREILFQPFGSDQPEEIDFYAETIERLERVENNLKRAVEIENEAWKILFAERFFERIADLPTKRKAHNQELHLFAKTLLQAKKEREIAPLEKVVNMFADK